MSKPDKRPVHVAQIKKTSKGKVHVSICRRRTFRQDGTLVLFDVSSSAA